MRRPGSCTLPIAAILVIISSCRPKPFENLRLCVLPGFDRVIVEVSASCASDHEGAELSCEIERDGNELHVTTEGHDGKDPNGACADSLTATCESEVLPNGEYTVHFDDDTRTVTIPSAEDDCDTD